MLKMTKKRKNKRRSVDSFEKFDYRSSFFATGGEISSWEVHKGRMATVWLDFAVGIHVFALFLLAEKWTPRNVGGTDSGCQYTYQVVRHAK